MRQEQYSGPEADILDQTIHVGPVYAGSIELPEDDLEEKP